MCGEVCEMCDKVCDVWWSVVKCGEVIKVCEIRVCGELCEIKVCGEVCEIKVCGEMC